MSQQTGLIGATSDFPSRALNGAAIGWFVVTVLSQLIFAFYIAAFYGSTAFQGRMDRWTEVMPHGHVAGDTIGNAAVAIHLLFAVLIIIGGALQLITGVRRRWPRFHRWNGRVYMVSAAAMSLGGLFMLSTRGTVGDSAQHAATAINALLILICAAMALRHAIARRIDLHRRWALRLFLVVGGVWMFRVGLTLWIVINQGPVGFDPKTFQGPFLVFLGFAQYLLPLLVLECWFGAQRSGAAARIAMAAMLGVFTLMIAAGTATAAMILWLPRL